MMRRAVVLLTAGAALAPGAAFAARTLSETTAENVAFAEAQKDERTLTPAPGAHWLAPEISCHRKASTWMTCRYKIGESKGGGVGRVCSRRIEVRLRSGKPAPVVTRQPLACKP